MSLAAACLGWLRAWVRTIGHEHTYTNKHGIEARFCLICGKYR